MPIDEINTGDPVCSFRDKVNELIEALNELTAASPAKVPLGAILDWWGDPEDVDIWDVDGIGLADTDMFGFAQCLGQALTGATAKDPAGVTVTVAPDLQGLMTVGQSTSDADFAVIGDDGGEKTVLLTADESGLPAHNHEYTNPTYSAGGAIPGSGIWFPDTAVTSTTGPEDAVVAHENMPPFMVMVKIYRYK